MPDMQMTAGYTSVLLRVDLLLSFFCLVGGGAPRGYHNGQDV